MSWLSKAAGAVGGAVSGAVSAVGNAAASVDPTSSKNVIGKAVGGIVRPVVATAKIATGVAMFEAGGSILARGVGAKKLGGFLGSQTRRTVAEAPKGYAIGATAGTAVLAGGGVASVIKAGAGKAAQLDAAAAQAVAPPPVQVAPVVAAPPLTFGGWLLSLVKGGTP